MRYLTLILAAAFLWSDLAAAQREPFEAIVVNIKGDGDTLEMVYQTDNGSRLSTVRLHEIDAPEKAQPFGEASRAYLEEIAMGAKVTAHCQRGMSYGRLVCRLIRDDGLDINLEMVSEGLAWAEPRYVKRKEILDAEQMARSARVGLWAGDCPVPPWKWRRLKTRAEALEECNP